jgi:hypothetical protein
VSDETTELPVAVGAHASTEASAPERARVCPSCGAFNVAEREVCRRCAVDLTSGDGLPWPTPDPDPRAAAILRDQPHPRRWLYALAAIFVAAVALLLGFRIAEVGPFSDGPSVPDARYEPSLYSDEPSHLVLSDIATVTTLSPESQRTFVAAHMVDDTAETAWRSDPLDGAVVADALEIVDLILEEPAWVDRVLIRNGDQLDLEAYEQEGRLREVRMVLDGGVMYRLNLLDEGRGQQVIELPEPRLTTMVRLEVLDYFPGSESDGVAVSDLELAGWPAVGPDERLAVRRAEALPADAPRGGNG